MIEAGFNPNTLLLEANLDILLAFRQDPAVLRDMSSEITLCTFRESYGLPRIKPRKAMTKANLL